MEKLGLGDVSPAIVFGRPALESVWLGPAQYGARAFAIQAGRSGGPALIVGPRACGKSIALDQILLALAPARFFRISESWDSGRALLAALVDSAGVTAAGSSEIEQRNRLQAQLDLDARAGGAAIFAVDDADRLSEDVWIELLRIGAMRAAGERPFMLFVGRPEAADVLQKVDRSAWKALQGRIHRMPSPSSVDCSAYIEHRLRVAGLDPTLFPVRVRTLVGKLARGSFVRTNLLAQGAILLARRRGVSRLTQELVFEATRTMAAAAAERGFAPPAAASRSPRAPDGDLRAVPGEPASRLRVAQPAETS